MAHKYRPDYVIRPVHVCVLRARDPTKSSFCWIQGLGVFPSSVPRSASQWLLSAQLGWAGTGAHRDSTAFSSSGKRYASVLSLRLSPLLSGFRTNKVNDFIFPTLQIWFWFSYNFHSTNFYVRWCPLENTNDLHFLVVKDEMTRTTRL